MTPHCAFASIFIPRKLATEAIEDDVCDIQIKSQKPFGRHRGLKGMPTSLLSQKELFRGFSPAQSPCLYFSC